VPAAIEKLQAEASAADDWGERQKALALQQDVMTWVKANLLAVHPFRAEALNNLGIYLSKMGQRAEALPPTLEAVKIRRELAKTNAAFLPDLAGSLGNLGNRYSELGQWAEALPPSLEAVKTYRELSKTNAAFLPDLARALNNLGIRYSNLGQRSEALPTALEAVKIRRELAKTNSGFLPDLARALNNLGVFYSELGQRAEALPPTLEAVKTYRELAKTNAAFLPDLAGFLTNLGNRYSELGQRSEALPPTIEAVNTFRALATINAAFLPDLAMALNNLGNCYSELGQPSEALPPTIEAVKTYRELSKTNAAFLPDLAMALNNLGNRYSNLGQRAEALPPTTEAIKTYRELAKTNPGFLPYLAGALGNLGLQYSALNQLDEAFPHAEEAVRLYTQLVATYPARFKDDLQRARNNLEDLRRKEDLQLGRTREIAPSDRTYLNTNDPNTPLRRSVVRIWPTFSGTKSGIGLLGTGFVVRREGDRAWIATARHVVLDPDNSAPPTKLEAELYSGALPPTLTTTRLSVVLPSGAESDASSGDDLILLEVKGLPPDMAPLPLGQDLPRGRVKVVGHPTGQPPWSVLDLPLLKTIERELFLDGALDSGASGSPVLDGDGKVLGLVYQTMKYGRTNPQTVVSAYRSTAIESLLQRKVSSPLMK
jgi:tetratricopeptide (TPR) repeat protein